VTSLSSSSESTIDQVSPSEKEAAEKTLNYQERPEVSPVHPSPHHSEPHEAIKIQATTRGYLVRKQRRSDATIENLQ
jgi:hypothetical protein